MKTRAVATLVALFVPVVLLVNGLVLISHEWFVRVEYSWLPPERYGMTTGERVRLATQALDSIVPWGDGRAALGPDFDAREVRHLGDVRTLVLALFAAHVFGVIALAALAVHRRTRDIAVRALRWGTLLTLAIAVFAGVYVTVSPVGFLGGFHRFFFEGDSWRFAETDTLRRLFPDRFWSDTAIVLGALTAVQALALVVADRVRRQASRRTARTPTA